MATFPKLADIRQLPDPLLNNRFTLIFPSIPGGGDGSRLQLQCTSAVLPGQNNEQVTATSHGYNVHFAGTPNVTGTFPLQHFETRDLAAKDAILGWVKYARNRRNATGNYKSDYERTGHLYLFDDKLQVIRQINLIGCFPTQVDDITLEGGAQGSIVTVGSNWSYDDVEEL